MRCFESGRSSPLRSGNAGILRIQVGEHMLGRSIYQLVDVKHNYWNMLVVILTD